MRLIFEGPDCGGKSTAIRQMFVNGSMPILHNGLYPSQEIAYNNYHRQLVESPMTCVFDRMHISEYIYGQIVRGYEIDHNAFFDIDDLAISKHCVVVLCMPDLDTIHEQYEKRKGEEYIQKRDVLDSVISMYQDLLSITSLPIVSYNWTEDSLTDLLETLAILYNSRYNSNTGEFINVLS